MRCRFAAPDPARVVGADEQVHRRHDEEREQRADRHAGDGLGQSWEHWFSLFPDAKSFFLVPIVRENDLLGVIYADYSRSNVQGWTSEELEAVEAIKQVVCAALQMERT